MPPAGKRPRKKKTVKNATRFPERNNKEWTGPIVSYREVEVLRKLTSSSSKIMSRKRSGTSSKEQTAIQKAIKQARFLALIPYSGT